MRGLIFLLIVIVGFMSFNTQVASQEKIEEKQMGPSEKNLNMFAEFGSIVIGGKTWTRISARPEIVVWKIGIGLDIELLIDENNNIRKEDWDDWGDVPRKIMFVRYGSKDDRFYGRIGSISNAVLGHGFIVDNYSNAVQYPEIKRIGLDIGINTDLFELELLLADLTGYDKIVDDENQKPDLIYDPTTQRWQIKPKTKVIKDQVKFGGVRFAICPLSKINIPVIKSIKLGATLCADLNVPSQKEEKKVVVYGADVELPIFKNLLFYGDFAMFKDYGKGLVFPGLELRFLSNGRFKLEYRNIDGNFIPGYFDSPYNIQRSTKLSFLESAKAESKKGWFSSLTYTLLNLANLKATFEEYSGENNGKFKAEISIVKGFIPQISEALVSYQRVGFDLKDFYRFKDENALIEAKLAYQVSGPMEVVLIYRQHFDTEGKPIKSTSVLTRVAF
jgi:hypothetical protein